jgi:formylglycine-generating enzyme required for sulfatase activity
MQQQPRWSVPASPAVAVDWYEAEAYCRARGQRLPTEAEWERAALAAEDACVTDKIDDYAWHRANSPHGARPVAGRKPNAMGIYDLQGNAAEWVSDWYAPDAYSFGPRKSPGGPDSGTEKVLRGGSWGDFACHYAANVRVTRRGRDYPARRSPYAGFRCARDAAADARP